MANALAGKSSWLNVRDQWESFLFILPAVVIFAIFYIYPFYETFNLSLHEWNGISLSRTFVGLDNFRDLIQDKVWWFSVWHAAYITLIALVFQNALAFTLALACDRQIRMKSFYCAVFFIPPILSEVVVGLIWRWILEASVHGGQQVGLLNHILYSLGLPHLVNNWLSDPKTALTCIAVVHSWKGFGWAFVMLLAGLQMINREIYEAAYVDGANAWQILRDVTVPMMVPVMGVVMILTILGSMQVFVLVKAMVWQGLVYHTEVPVTRILMAMMGTKQYGYACAMGVTFGAILIALSFVMKKVLDRVKQA